MNNYCILIDELPTTVIVGNSSYPICTDFRIGILLEQLLADTKCSKTEKLANALNLYFQDKIPDDYDEAMRLIQWFYSAGKEEFAVSDDEVPDKRKQLPKSKRPSVRILDYEIDAPLIYAAFLTQYGIDLQDVVDLHWWKFHAMLSGLKDDLPLSRIMFYRGVDLRAVKDKSLRKQYAALQAKYRLPSTMTEQERISFAGQIFAPRGINK